jgi:hypothetical protein
MYEAGKLETAKSISIMKKFLDFFLRHRLATFLNFITFHFHPILFCFVPLSLICMICKLFCNALNRVCVSSHPALLAAAVARGRR